MLPQPPALYEEPAFRPLIHYDKDMEAAIIGICLLEATAPGRAVNQGLTANHFYDLRYGQIWDTIKWMFDRSEPIDLITVTQRMARQGKLIGYHAKDNNTVKLTPYEITATTNYVTGSYHLEYWCYLLKRMWLERKISTITHGGFDFGEADDPFQKAAMLEGYLRDLMRLQVNNDWDDMTTLLVELFQHQDKMIVTGGIGLPLGFARLNKEGGANDGNFIVIGARPSIGKSALAIQIALGVARAAAAVGIISLEMPKVEVTARIVAQDTHTDFASVFRGLFLDEKEREELYISVQKTTHKLPIYVSDKTDVTPQAIRAKADYLVGRHGCKMLIIDYLQLINGDNAQRNRTREQEVSQISRQCKIIAKDLNIPVIALAQLGRGVEGRSWKDRLPQLKDLRESGAIEQDADIVMFLHSDFHAGWTTDDESGQPIKETDRKLIVRKWRNGNANFGVNLELVPGQMRFVEKLDQPEPQGLLPASKPDPDDEPF